MTTTAQDISLYSGESVTVTVTITSGGAAVNLASYYLRYAADTSPAQIVKYVGSGITVTNAAGGICQIAFTPADTTGKLQQTVAHELKAEGPTGVVSVVFTGALRLAGSLIADVTP